MTPPTKTVQVQIPGLTVDPRIHTILYLLVRALGGRVLLDAQALGPDDLADLHDRHFYFTLADDGKVITLWIGAPEPGGEYVMSNIEELFQLAMMPTGAVC